MDELILHIGLPKTGSSALQVFFAQNRGALLKHSLEYFQIGPFGRAVQGLITSGNGMPLAHCLTPRSHFGHKDSLSQEMERLMEAIAASGARRGLLSSEVFTHAEPDALRQLVQAVSAKGIRTRIIYFIRRQDQHFITSYIQGVKRGDIRETPEVFITRAIRAGGSEYRRYHSFFTRLASIAGRENVICRVFEDAIRRPDGLMHTFLEPFEVTPQGMKMPGAVNTSLSRSELVIMLLLNRLRPRVGFSDSVVENSIIRGASGVGQEHSLLSADLVREIKAAYREENAKMAREYFGREELFDWPDARPNDTGLSSTALSLEDVIEVIGGLAVRLDEKVARVDERIVRLESDAARVARERATPAPVPA